MTKEELLEKRDELANHYANDRSDTALYWVDGWRKARAFIDGFDARDTIAQEELAAARAEAYEHGAMQFDELLAPSNNLGIEHLKKVAEEQAVYLRILAKSARAAPAKRENK